MLLSGSGQGCRRVTAALSVVCAAALLLSGCGDDAEPSSQFKDDQGLRSRVDTLAEKYRFGLQDGSGATVDLQIAHEKLVRRCLRDKGFDIGDPPPAGDPGTVLPSVDELRLWLARGEPLGLGAAVSDPRRLQQMRSVVATAKEHEEKPYPPGAQEVVDGDPPVTITVPLPGGHGGSVTIPVGGCFGSATQELYGVPAETFERTRLALPRLDDTVSETVADASVARLLDSYASCMRDHDLDVETPERLTNVIGPAAESVLEGSGQPAELVAAENRAITADADCKARSGVGTAFARAFEKHGSATLARTEGVVVEYRRMLDHARGVVATLGPQA